MKEDSFGDRMKYYEGLNKQRLLPNLPIMARLDGRSFHNFTKGMISPYDHRLRRSLVLSAKYIVQETNAKFAYVQSDEINLTWYNVPNMNLWFGGKLEKWSSVLASMVTASFISQYLLTFEELRHELHYNLPSFDCRVWNVPNTTEGANTFLWRMKDNRRNALHMYARTKMSHNELHGMTSNDIYKRFQHEFVKQPMAFQNGTFLRKVKVLRSFTEEELSNLPEKHFAHTNPDMEIERSEIEETSLISVKIPSIMDLADHIYGVVNNGRL
jgi:tRNA(His) 5'-end guanylyltransferase